MDASACSSARAPRRHRLLAAGALFVAVGAYFGSIGLVGGWLSFGDRLNERLPLASPVLAGAALFLFVAVPYTVLTVRAWRGAPSTGPTSIVLGVGLVAWIVVQLAFLREFSAFQPVYAAIGAAFIVAGRSVRAQRVPDVDIAVVERFLGHQRVVMIGATDDPKKFGATLYRAFEQQGHEVVPVNPHRDSVAGIRCLPDLPSVPGRVDAVIIVLEGSAAYEAVRACVQRGVSVVWLFRGVGSLGAWSPEAVELCRANGVAVVAGACPLMFLGSVTGAHHAHLRVRRFAHAVA